LKKFKLKEKYKKGKNGWFEEINTLKVIWKFFLYNARLKYWCKEKICKDENTSTIIFFNVNKYQDLDEEKNVVEKERTHTNKIQSDQEDSRIGIKSIESNSISCEWEYNLPL